MLLRSNNVAIHVRNMKMSWRYWQTPRGIINEVFDSEMEKMRGKFEKKWGNIWRMSMMTWVCMCGILYSRTRQSKRFLLDWKEKSHLNNYIYYNMYVVYIISCSNRSYVGSTLNFPRRLRQHNGEIKGGAKRTRKRVWVLHTLIEGFTSRTEALRFEWALQHPRRSLRYKQIIHNAKLKGMINCPNRKLQEATVMVTIHDHLYITTF